jgi:hypothetical protein
MIRTRDIAASLRIEVRRSGGRCHIALVDPNTEAELLIAENLQDSTIKDLNRYVWTQLDSIAKKLKTDPELTSDYCSTVIYDIFTIGFRALLELIRNSDLDIERVQDFCSLVVAKDRASPPIIEVVAGKYDHLFFEVMPLLGRFNGTAEVASLITGFNAIVRHRLWEEQHAGNADDSPQVSVRFFQHTGLPGSVYELRQLRNLEKRGKARVSLQYPPKRYRPDDIYPEKELAKLLADPWFQDTAKGERGPGSICHLSCHLKQVDEDQVLELRPDGRFAKAARYRIDRIDVEFHLVPIIPPNVKLCFVSACKSAAIERSLLLSAMDAFRELRPESIVGTLGSIPDLTAAQFALVFYELLGEGWPIGAALWRARSSLLEAPFHNPLGLLFVSYSGEDVHFARPAGRFQHLIPDENPDLAPPPTKGL